ncbi:indolepyruvate ferredoxin oxidoreductase family protein [Paracoccaceae bacterium GXU_MW_L88]
MLQDVSLSDRFDLGKKFILLSGIQALARLPLMQAARDEASGLQTGGLVTGYRGSPLGGVDSTLFSIQNELKTHDIVFEPGLNEDLAATMLWGSQQAELRGEGKYQGVFGLWYGKGPGVDRCGDVFRHANMAGTAEHGGVLVAMGDDHTGESSTVLNHSEFALVDALMPILSPAGVQEILDYGVIGWELSRYCGCWVGIKSVKDTVEVTEVVNGDPHRIEIRRPTEAEFAMPEGGLNIRLGDTPVEQEARMHDYKRFAAEAFGRANKLDKRMMGNDKAKIGIVSSGKSWLDTVHALQLLGIDEAEAERLGITTYKVGMVWPLDMESFREWAEDLETIIVVEEKRKLIEVQIKEAIYDDRRGRRVLGWKDEKGNVIFSVKMALDPVKIARTIGDLLDRECDVTSERLDIARGVLADAQKNDNAEEIAARMPWFCSGCPHNSSTKVPEGSRAYAGIGCHYMVQWMDRETTGFTHMGGEGVNWIGEAPFSKRKHVFQNLGDGTYNHSGVLAVRAALAADTTITYKILYNDAVAMTGGQHNEGDLQPEQIVKELNAMGVKRTVVVYDEKEDVHFDKFPGGTEMVPRSELLRIQKELSETEGVTAIVYIQTCAAEKRRRRKRGKFPDPDRRVMINPAVCEGCGDCGVQSNCISIVPLETELGRKREIDQSSCNKDFSCLDGFCPSFVTVEGAKVRKPEAADISIPDLPEPDLPSIDGTFNTVITGVGGTGVVTVGAVLAMAAHLEGKGAGLMEMAGLAQKGGAVYIHCRIADKPKDISAIRIAVGEADSIIGCDLVVSAGAKMLGLMTRGRTKAVVNSHEIITGQFTRDRDFHLPTERLEVQLKGRLGEEAISMMDVTKLSARLLGDAIYANMMMLGGAYQMGLIPVSREAIFRAIELNGAKPDANKRAFDMGRWAISRPEEAEAAVPDPAKVTEIVDPVAYRADHIRKYQDKRLRDRFLARVDSAPDEDLRVAVAKGYHKLLTYKDEYEVARLHHETLESAIDHRFSEAKKVYFHLAPPLLPLGKDNQGRPKKIKLGPWMGTVFGWLAKGKRLRGTPFDPFGYMAERKMERALITQFEADMDEILPKVTADTHDLAIALMELPLEIRGFGPVKEKSAEAAAKKREELLAAFRAGGTPTAMAAE